MEVNNNGKRKMDLKEKIDSYKFELGLLQKIPCSKEENKQYKELLKAVKRYLKECFHMLTTQEKSLMIRFIPFMKQS